MNSNEIKPKNQTDIIIIGSGLAGISIASEIKNKYNHSSIILEKDAEIASSWRNMPEFISLISPWYCNRPLRYLKYFNPTLRMPTKQYAMELESFSKTEHQDCRLNQKVQLIEKSESKTKVITQDQTYLCKAVVIATGYYSYPYIPSYPGIGNSKIPSFHFKDYNSHLQKFKTRKKILIVGKRISAGQLLLELNRNHDVSISTRSEITYGPGEFIWSILFPIYPIIEDVFKFFNISKAPGAVSMFGGKTKSLIQSNKIIKHPDIKQFSENEIEFIDGTKRHYDLVIFTTGFKFADDLKSFFNLDSVFKIGKEGQIDFRSRFLRGIRLDAKNISKKVAKFLNETIK